DADARGFGLEDGIGGARRRDVDDGGFGAGGFDSFAYRIEDGEAEVFGAALAGGDAADVVGAVLEPLLGVEGSVFPGDALGDDLGVFGDENGHGDSSSWCLV